jgi:hypothetical protein
MDRNAYRDDNRTDQAGTHVDQRETYPDQRETEPEAYSEPDTYWRRRAATLAAGLGVLGLLAWAFSGGGGAPASHNAATSAPAAASPSAPTSLPAGTLAGAPAGASAGAASAGAGADASPGASANAGAGADAAVPGLASQGTSGLPSAASSAARKPAKSAKSAKSASSSGASAHAAHAAQAAQGAQGANTTTEPGGRCAPGSVVLSLFSGSRDYPGGQEPAFGVDVVSTAPGTCSFDLSPTQFHMVVMSAGRVIWDSADCARADGTHLGKLTRGVPVQQSFTWNRAITLPGCVTLASSARPGSYTAQARTASISSEVYSFKLVR